MFSIISCSLEPFALHRKTVWCFRVRLWFLTLNFSPKMGLFLPFRREMRDDFVFFNKHAWKKPMYFVSICTSTYIMEVKTAWLILHDIRLSVCEKRQLHSLQMPTINIKKTHFHLEKITGALWRNNKNDLLLQIVTSAVKGICRICLWGLHLSPSLPLWQAP